MRYFIVISPDEVEGKTVVHGCHCPGDMALYKCKALAIMHVAQRCVVLPSFSRFHMAGYKTLSPIRLHPNSQKSSSPVCNPKKITNISFKKIADILCIQVSSITKY